MNIKDLVQFYDLQIPIADDGVFWNGRPDKWSNLKKYRLRMSQRFGMQLLDYFQFGLKGHNGVDIAGLKRTPIVAPCKLCISWVNNSDRGYGYNIFAETEQVKRNGEYYKLEMCFGHLDEIIAKKSHWYEKGDLLGYMDSTGFSTGHHLHFGIRPWQSDNGNDWLQTASNNGYRGYVDPEEFLPKIIWDYNDLIKQEKMIKDFEKKIIIEGEGFGRKGIIINGKLREIKKGREGDACLYALANNKHGKTINSEAFDDLPQGEDF